MENLKIKSIYHFNKNEIEYLNQKYNTAKIIAVCVLKKTKFTLDEKGNVSISGKNPYGVFDKEQWKNVKKISCGKNHIVGLKNDGTVVAFGDNILGQCNVSMWRDVIMLSTGDNITIGITRSGKVLKTQVDFKLMLEKENSQLNNELKNTKQQYAAQKKEIISQALNSVMSLSIHSKGNSVRIKDDNRLNAVLNFDNLISCGNSHIACLKSNRTVIVSGKNKHHYFDVSNWKNIVAVSAGWEHTVGLQSDGTVVSAGNNDYNQCNVSDWKNIVSVSSGWEHIAGLQSDGTVLAAGSNDYRQCDVSEWKNIVSISL